jgi:hypothetical protein
LAKAATLQRFSDSVPLKHFFCNAGQNFPKEQVKATAMKTKILLKKLIPPIVILASVVALCTSQSQVQSAPPPGPVEQAWVARYNGSANLDDGGHAIVGDNAGNVYVTGGSHGLGTDLDYATINYNSAGQEAWVARYNGPANGWDRAAAIARDSSGNVYATGQSLGLGTDYDYATVKYDSAGQQQWVARYNGPGNGEDDAVAVATDGSGNVYVTGQSLGLVNGFDYATIKYDSAGQQQWVARYNSGYYDLVRAIAVDSSGNVYVTGRSAGLGTGPDYVTIKYDSAGQQQWVARYNGPGNDLDEALAIAIDSSGNVYVTGHSAAANLAPDYATIKYDSAGQEQWVTRYNGTGNFNDAALAIAVDSSGNIYVTGSSDGTRSSDYATVKYSSAGQEQWVARYNGPGRGYDDAEGIVIDGSGNVYVTGPSVSRRTGFDYATIKYVQNPTSPP